MTELKKRGRIKYWIFLATIAILFLGFIIAKWIFPKESPLLTYDDPMFEQMLESQYRILPNGFIMAGTYYTEEDAKKLKGIKLFFKYGENSDLKDLDKFPNLVAINIDNATEEMLKKISELDKIESLQIVPAETKTDISVIRNMKNLKCLIIMGGTYQQWEFIKDMPQLETLSILYVDMDNLKFISDLPRLTRITIEDCRLKDMSALGKMPQLEYFGINNIQDDGHSEIFESIKNLKNLKQLFITNCPGVTDVQFIRSLTDLEWVQLDCIGTTNINCFTDIENYPKLSKLYLSDDIRLANPELYRVIDHILLKRNVNISPDFRDSERSNKPFDFQ